MEEGDLPCVFPPSRPGAAPRRGVDRLDAGRAEGGEGGVDVVDLDRDVVEARAALLEKAPDRSVGRRRLEQLEEDTAEAVEGRPDLLGRDLLGADADGAEALPDRRRLGDRPDGYGDVREAAEMAARRRAAAEIPIAHTIAMKRE